LENKFHTWIMKFQKSLLYLANLSLIVPLLVHSYFGLFSRYLADDFCTSGQYKSQGFITSLQFWRLTWSGRYSFYFFMNVSHFIGEWISPYLTGIAIAIWLFTLYILFRQLAHIIHIPNSSLPTLMLAGIVLFLTLDGTPDIYQSLYWQTGLVTYVVPLLFLTGYGALTLNRIAKNAPIRRVEIAVSAGMTFLAGGFSETYVTLQIIIVLILLFVVTLFIRGEKRRSSLLFLGSGLFGGIAALILVTTAPGNAARLSFMLEPLAVPELLYLTFRYPITFAKNALYHSPISSTIALLVPGLLALFLPIRRNLEQNLPFPKRKIFSFLIIVPIVAYLLIAGSMAPSFYATATFPVERVLITAQFILAFAFTVWSLLLGITFQPYFGNVPRLSPIVLGFVVLLLISGAFTSSQKTLSRLPEAQIVAGLWDVRDKYIRQEVASGALEISAMSLPHMSPGLAELSTDPNDWVNRCLALNYGLSKVTAK
jgi:hypothetical protein